MRQLPFQVIERHFTLDKTQKGTDHRLSLEPMDFRKMVDNIRAIEAAKVSPQTNEEILAILSQYAPSDIELESVAMALPEVSAKEILECEMLCRRKLGKSLVYRGDLAAGDALSRDDIDVKVSEPFGITAERLDEFIGRELRAEVTGDDRLEENHFV